jgi:hypothetical protein
MDSFGFNNVDDNSQSNSKFLGKFLFTFLYVICWFVFIVYFYDNNILFLFLCFFTILLPYIVFVEAKL